MQRLLRVLGTLVALQIAGCSPSADTPRAITEEEYRKGLQVQASIKDQHLVVTTSTAAAAHNLRDVRRVFLITEAGEHGLGEVRGSRDRA